MTDSFFKYTKYHLPIIGLIWLAWYCLAGPTPFWFIEQYWPVSLTMVFGSLVAGATAGGGGTIAFPIFTKLFYISPMDAKIFSLAIQSVGMTSASLLIILMRISVEWRAIIWASIGGFGGLLIGIQVAPYLAPDLTKLIFTALVGSFAFTLAISNSRGNLIRYRNIRSFGRFELVALLTAGFTGGVISGLVGNGIDIISFSLMVLLFRICETVATPTAVVLMAINALFGFLLECKLGAFSPNIRAYWLASIPIVCIGAPFGAFLCTLMNRLTIARLLIGLIFVEIATTFMLIPLTAMMLVFCLTLFVVFLVIYYSMYRNSVDRYRQASNTAPEGKPRETF